MNKAVDYLARYATSQHRLREVLGRFAMRKLDKHDPDKIAAAINATSHAAKHWDILMMTPLPKVRLAATASKGGQSLVFASVFANTGLMTPLSMPRLMRLISGLQMANYWPHADLQGGADLALLTAGNMMMKKTVRHLCNASNASLDHWHGLVSPWRLAKR